MRDNVLENNIHWIATKYSCRINFVLHVGGHVGQECATYDLLGIRKVVWVEGDPDLYLRLRKNIGQFHGQSAYCCLVTEADGQRVKLHRTNNDGQSSSVLEINDEKMSEEYPGLSVSSIVEMKGSRLDTFIKNNNINLSSCNLLSLDVQGYELAALRSLGSMLGRFEVVCSEVNLTRIYRGGTLLHQLEAYLVRHGFTRVWIAVSGSQGEAWYVKRQPTLLTKLLMRVSTYSLEVLQMFDLLKVLRRNAVFLFFRRQYYRSKSKDDVG